MLVSLALKAFPQDMQYDVVFKILLTITQPWFEQVLAGNSYTGSVSDTQGSHAFLFHKNLSQPPFYESKGFKDR